MAGSNHLGNGLQDVPLRGLENTLTRTETVDVPPSELLPTSPRSQQRNFSVSSESGSPFTHAARHESRGFISTFSQRYRGSISSGRSPSLTPAETYYFVREARSNSLAAAMSFTPATSHDESDSDEDLAGETKNPDLQRELPDLLASVYRPPIPTPHCLQQFRNVVARQIDPDIQMIMDKHLSKSKAERAKHNDTLSKLRAWSKWKAKENTIFGWLGWLFRSPPALPDHEELVNLAKHYFPLRADVIVHVCDFGENYFHKEEVPLGEIDNCTLYAPSLIIGTKIKQTCMISRKG
jgi:hypothetical protein